MSKDSAIITLPSSKRTSKQIEEDIRTLKQQMEFILGVTKTGLDIIDSEFNVRYIDPEWTKVYGDPTGKKCYQYFMDRSGVCPGCGIPKALETKTITVSEEILVKEGGRPIQVTTIPFQNTNGEWLVAEVNVDISEHKCAEEALRKAHDELEIRVQERTAEVMSVVEALQNEMTERNLAEESLRKSEEEAKRFAQENAIMAEIGRIISSSLNIEDVYEQFATEAHKLIPFDGIAINMINHKEGTVTVPYVAGINVPRCQPRDAFPLEGSVTGEVAYKRAGLIIRISDKDDFRDRFHTLLTAFDTGLRSVLAVPLISKDQVIGAIHFRSTRPKAYSDRDLKLAENIASQIAGAIANAQLYYELRQTEEALKLSEFQQRTTIDSMGDAIHVVDEELCLILVNKTLREWNKQLGLETKAIGKTVFQVYPFLPDKIREEYRFVFETGEPLITEESNKIGNREIITETRKIPNFEEEKVHRVVTVIRDITERKNNDEKILRQSALLDGINKLLIEALTCQTEEEIANKCLNVAQALSKSKFGFIGEINPSGHFDTIAMSDPGWESCRIPRSDSVLLINNMEMRGIWASVLKEERPLIVNDPAAHPNCVGTPEGHPPITSFLGVPLKHMHKTIGMIALANKETVYDSIDQQDIETLGTVFVEALMRKRAEEALRESEERYRTILENIEDGYYEVDLPGNFTFFNDPVCRLFGYSKDELMGMNDRQYTDREHATKLYQTFNKVYRTGEPSKGFDWEIIRKDGTKRYIEASISLLKNPTGQPTGFRGIVRDITERKRAEEALKESEEKYRLLVENAAEAIFVAQDGMLKFANHNTTEMIGYSKEELTSKPFQEFIHPDDRELVLDRHLKRLKGQELPSVYPFRIVIKSKNVKWVELNAVRITWQGRPATLNFLSDITERKRTEEEMIALQEQLRQSQKMEAIGQLAGGIAHDFNNLLTVIKGYSQLSLLDLKESHPLWGNIQEIHKAAQRATDLTRQLLAFGRRQILDLKVLDLNTLLKDLDKMLRRIIGEDIELVTLLEEALGRVKIDPGQIEQVIFNLAVNARDAMPSGGKLIIETTNIELNKEYADAHIGVIPGGYVRLSVSDTGFGMSREVSEKVFEPFFTTKDKGKGTGLGLSTVYGIVKQSGGNIWVYSEPGHGTTFKIYLPRVEEELDNLHVREEPECLPRGSETVLLVEDEREVRLLAHRLLGQQGYRVLEAPNGEEALHVAQEHAGEEIHLLLTDVVMPQMGGKELADQLKILRPNIKVLYVSGYTDNAIVHHGVLDPGTHFLQKPFSQETLSHKVREVLDR